jgi:transcriptional regulator with XRE-family HTH domain
MDRSVDPVGSVESGFNASLLAQEVGRRIKEARLERGWSRRDFGAKLGVSGQQIQKYESGKDAVPLHRLLVLSSICGVSPQTFWGQNGSTAVIPGTPHATDVSTLQLVRAYRRIGDATLRKRLLQLITQMAGDNEEPARS